MWTRAARCLLPATHVEVLKRLFQNVDVQIWNRCGHAPQIECADRFNTTMLEFLRRVDSSR
jgi:pimeloyl-ACP methyl ester carboxylesterase